MSSSPFLLNGEVDNSAEQIASLQEENSDLKHDLAMARAELAQAKKDNARAIAALRRQLSPLFTALKQVFGEMDAFGNDETPDAPQANARWESWKQRMPGRPAEFIDLLLVHKTMTIKQFMAAAHCGQDSAYKTVSKLGQAGVTENSGGKYSLKQS